MSTIGGTGVKASLVDVTTGSLTVTRDRVPTPHPATPHGMIESIRTLLDDILRPSPDHPPRMMGVGFPGVVKDRVVMTSAHLDPSWINTDAAALLGKTFGCVTHVVNDADAAGLAEVRFGAGAGVHGVVLMLTLGTGIGTGLFIDGTLVPNTELGHLSVDGKDAETRAAASVREREDLSWEKWGRRLDRYLAELERLLWPDLIIIGGGVSEHFDRFADRLDRVAQVVPAHLGNDAGFIGAALWAAQQSNETA